MAAWEYMVVSAGREVQFKPDEVKYWLHLGAQPARELKVPGTDGVDVLDAFNRLGQEGWELIGPPDEQKVAMTYLNAAGNYMNYSDWSSRTYRFKRQVP